MHTRLLHRLPAARKISLLLDSLSQLKIKQVVYFAIYRSLGYRKVSGGSLPDLFRSAAVVILHPLDRPIVTAPSNRIQFLNKSRELDIANMDWCPSDASRLWCYNLHYFDFLRQEDLPDIIKGRLIDSWITKNPQQSRPGWEPYTTSLRIVNWIGYFSGKEIPKLWHDTLFLQARWLFANLEHHILANHYFENIKALVFAYIYFHKLGGDFSKDVTSWQRFALVELESQLKEQFLGDGGHYERSPQYHLIMIKNCIEILRLLELNGPADLDVCGLLRTTISKGLALSVLIARPDKKIPLMNDSAFDQTPALDPLIEAASSMGVAVAPSPAHWTTVNAPDFGLYGVRNHSDWLIIDCGEIGPSYQPGHTHCDLLSFELMVRSRMLVVDTGVFEYDATPLRRMQRSTQAHNTVCVEGVDQSQVWGAFRVAQRAQKLSAFVRRVDQTMEFEGSYRGFYSSRGSVRHSRKVRATLTESAIRAVCINDCLDRGSDSLECIGFVHFHPDVRLIPADDRQYLLYIGELQVALLTVEKANECSIEDWLYSPEFGIHSSTKRLVIKSQDNCIAYTITVVSEV